MSAASIYPLVFEPILKEKVWGGRRLESYGKILPGSAGIGESWELADLSTTSASGGGGGEARSVIANGSMAGRTLHQAIRLWGGDLLGEVKATPEGGFPLLVKLLDARQNLSVQVHPSPEYASASPGAHPKNECWYVLEAEPGSVIFKGIKPGVGPRAFAAAVEKGTAVDCLVALAAEPGDCHSLPSGTIHALGAGVLVAEFQTPGDTTFRVYDWAVEYGRGERPLHVKQALECIDYGPPPEQTRLARDQKKSRLAQADSFDLWEFRLESGRPIGDLPGGNGCAVLMVLSGEVRLSSGDGGFEELRLTKGMTVLIPAGNRGAVELLGMSPGELLAVAFL